MGTSVLLWLGIIVYFCLQFIIALEFYLVAVEKGYDNKKYFWFSFFLGIVGYLLVIALPDRIDATTQSIDELPEI